MKSRTPREVLTTVATALPLLIFLAVAARQVVLVHAGGLSPWKGGGFGLFSTIDAGAANREISCIAQDTAGRLCRIHVTFSGEGQEEGFDRDFRNKLLSYPDPDLLRSLGRKLLEAEFVPGPTRTQLLRSVPPDTTRRARFGSATPEPAVLLRLPGGSTRGIRPDLLVRIRAVRLSVWRLRFDPDSRRIEWERVGETVQLGRWI